MTWGGQRAISQIAAFSWGSRKHVSFTPLSRWVRERDPAIREDSPQRMKVQLFVTCLVDLAYPEVGERTVALLERLGCEVEFPRGQTCCGQPAYNSGHPSAARRVAAAWVNAFADTDGPIVAPFGSCVHMVRHGHRRLVDDDPRARAVAGRVRDLASFIVDDLDRHDVGGRYPGDGDGHGAPVPVAWHDECHLLRGLGTAGAARTLLAGVAGCELVATERPELCCGFGGTFALKVPAVSAAMADEKLDRALEAGARAIVSTDPGCLMHLEGRARRRGLDLAVHHLVDLLEPEGGL
jgi:L-lactate dehydrogenase complex protein LldE